MKKANKKDVKVAAIDLMLTAATCGLYFVVIFLRVLFTTKSGQALVEEKIDKKIKAKILEKEDKEDDKHDA